MQQSIRPPLILGGTGCVGRALAALWPAQTPAVWQSRNRQAGTWEWDILHSPAPALPQTPSGIIALAGVTRGDAADLAANTALALAACDLADALGGLPVLLASSQAVYGAPAQTVTENSPCAPTTPYGHAKRAMEQAVAGRKNVTCLRIGNVAGCDGLLMHAARVGHVRLDQFPNGQGPTRAYIGPRVLGDVLRGLLAIGADLPPVLNIAQRGQIAMADLLRAADVPWKWAPAGAGALPVLAMNCDALAQLVSNPPATPADLIAQARAAGWKVSP